MVYLAEEKEVIRLISSLLRVNEFFDFRKSRLGLIPRRYQLIPAGIEMRQKIVLDVRFESIWVVISDPVVFGVNAHIHK